MTLDRVLIWLSDIEPFIGRLAERWLWLRFMRQLTRFGRDMLRELEQTNVLLDENIARFQALDNE